jgi:hypothetical protein
MDDELGLTAFIHDLHGQALDLSARLYRVHYEVPDTESSLVSGSFQVLKLFPFIIGDGRFARVNNVEKVARHPIIEGPIWPGAKGNVCTLETVKTGQN